MIVKLHGGAGNQLFQLAFALWLRLQTGDEVRLDEWLIDIPGQGIRRNCVLEECAASSLLLPPKNSQWFWNILRGSRLVPPKATSAVRAVLGINLINERELSSYDRQIVNEIGRGRQNIFLGYWQNHRYAGEVRAELLELLDWKITPADACFPSLEHISREQDAVSLHIRRGDYMKLASAPVLGTAYYERAIRAVLERLAAQGSGGRSGPRPVTFFAFSDDLAWCRGNVPPLVGSVNDPRFNVSLVFVEGKDSQASHKDLCLMRNCGHHILANSTFSWWGAWSNPRTEKVVIAPYPWMPDRKPVPGLFPGDWITVESGF